jgi:hypothetical protein
MLMEGLTADHKEGLHNLPMLDGWDAHVVANLLGSDELSANIEAWFLSFCDGTFCTVINDFCES